tara:strand:- start:19 stop:837 length:819 start_codon:yes stop_codon:yes gene_type:complete
MKLFIDADSIMFKAACTQSSKHETRVVTRKIIEDSIADCFADEVYITIKGKGNFRYNVYPDYKSSRKNTELEEKLKERLNDAHAYLLKDWSAVQADGMEADDVVCIWAHEAREAEQDFVIAHIDKDINQVAGNHYNYNSKQIYFVDDDTADMNFCTQLLIGDNGDDIPKVKKGYGIKTAQKALAETTYDNRMDTVVDVWQRLYGKGWEKQLNMVGNLIYMKRTWDLEEWNYEDRYTGKANERKPNGRDTSDTNEGRKELHADVPDQRVQGVS